MSLYIRIYDWDNLLLARCKVSKGKQDESPAARFEHCLKLYKP